MSVRIRLNRIGKKHVPFGRIVAIDSRKAREGSCLADLGTYNFLKSAMVCFDEKAFDYWVSVGAQPSDSVKKIIAAFKKLQKQLAAKDLKQAPKAKEKIEKPAQGKSEKEKPKQ